MKVSKGKPDARETRRIAQLCRKADDSMRYLAQNLGTVAGVHLIGPCDGRSDCGEMLALAQKNLARVMGNAIEDKILATLACLGCIEEVKVRPRREEDKG